MRVKPILTTYLVAEVGFTPIAGLAIGRMLGRKPMYPEYLVSDESEDPDPAALAELTEDGRLRDFDEIRPSYFPGI